VIDGEDTTLNTGNQTAFLIQGPAEVTVEGFRLAIPVSTPTGVERPAIGVTGSMTRARFFDLTIDGNGGTAVDVSGSAEVTIAGSHVGSLSSSSGAQLVCSNARLTVSACVLESSIVESSTCTLTVSRNRFESSHDGSVHGSGGQLVMENNLVIHRDGFNDSILATNLQPGSTIRFNTLVNTTALPSDGAALSCDPSVLVSSNVFAYNSGHPITGQGCQTRYSIFDDKALTAAGTGNKVTGIETIFIDRNAGNYHLAEASVAQQGAEPGLDMVTVDFDGLARPAPAGTVADSGAFEAP
jgi:hypothetical protein